LLPLQLAAEVKAGVPVAFEAQVRNGYSSLPRAIGHRFSLTRNNRTNTIPSCNARQQPVYRASRDVSGGTVSFGAAGTAFPESIHFVAIIPVELTGSSAVFSFFAETLRPSRQIERLPCSPDVQARRPRSSGYRLNF
jgi:hypothetical protein